MKMGSSMGQKSVHDGHRSRVKEELSKIGLDHFPPHKVLETLLFYAIPRGDTNEIGHNLIERFGSLAGVLGAPAKMLQRTPGIGPESAAYLHLIGCVARRYMEECSGSTHQNIRDCAQAKVFIRHKLLAEQNECVYLLCLGKGGNQLYGEKIATGTGSRVDLSLSKVIKIAIGCSAAKVVLAHNHPGGICNPSREDLHTTALVHQELRRLDIELMDHIIVAPDGVCSMAEQDMLP